MVASKRPRTATFLVRLWVEGDGEPNATWRGQVEHVQSGDKQYICDMAQVVGFIEERFGQQLAAARDGGIR